MYIERQLEKKFIAINKEYACVLLTGPRQVGKSTMLRHLMEGTARAEVSLDDLAERRLAKTDPAMFLKLHPAPVLIDEVQYSAIAPIPLSSFAGEPSQNVGRSFLKSYAAVCLEGAIIVLSCIIFSHFAASPPIVKTDAAAVTMVWSYIGELIFNMLILVGSVKMSDRIVREMMGL